MGFALSLPVATALVLVATTLPAIVVATVVGA